MKKFLIIFLTITMLYCVCVSSFADETAGNIYTIGNTTIVFEENSVLTEEQQLRIAEMLVNSEYGISQANALCTLFGHKEVDDGFYSITHKVRAESPRCMRENFIVTTCSRCDYQVIERTSFSYLTCCPEE